MFLCRMDRFNWNNLNTQQSFFLRRETGPCPACMKPDVNGDTYAGKKAECYVAGVNIINTYDKYTGFSIRKFCQDLTRTWQILRVALLRLPESY